MCNNKKADIKKEFKDDITVLTYLFSLYTKELKRCKTYWNGTTYRTTRKKQLQRLRIQINEIMRSIEETYNQGYYEEV